MVIGIDASRANAEHRTGTEWYAFHLIQELKRLIPSEHQVVLYSKEPLRSDLLPLPGHWQPRVLGWPPVFLWTQLRLSWEMLRHRPDLLYIPAHTIPLIHPRRVAVVVHDVGFARQAALYDPKTIGNRPLTQRLLNLAVRVATFGQYSASERDYHRFALHLAVNRASAIITISQFSKQEIAELYPAATDRLAVIPNGFSEPPAVTAEGEPTLKKFGISRPYVLFVGRVEEKKNVPRLIDAWQQVVQSQPTAELVLAGRPGYGAEAIDRQIAERGLASRIRQTGYVAQEDLAVLLKSATAFVLPSLYEGFGIPVLEAMASGVPVACSRIPALEETAGEAARYFDPEDSGEIARALTELLADTTLRDTLINRGHQQCQRFSWRRTAEGTWEILNRLLADRP